MLVEKALAHLKSVTTHTLHFPTRRVIARGFSIAVYMSSLASIMG